MPRPGTRRLSAAAYLLLVLVNLVLTTVSVGWLVDVAHVEYRLAKLGVAAVIALVNFVVMRLWVFSP